MENLFLTAFPIKRASRMEMAPEHEQEFSGSGPTGSG